MAALWATRRRLLLGVGGLLVAAAVPAGILAARDRSALRALGTLQHGNVISALSFSPDGKTLASTETGGGAVRVWDVADRKERARTVPSSMVFTLAFSPDGRTLTTGGIEGAQFWDAATLNLLGEITSPGGTPEETFVTIAFSPNGRSFAASGFDDNQIRFYNPDTRELDGPPLPGGRTSTMAFSRDGGTLVSDYQSVSGGDANSSDVLDPGSLLFWDVAARKLRFVQPLNVSMGAENLVFSPDGAMVAASVGPPTNDVRLFRTATGNALVQTLGGNGGTITGLAYGDDGHTVVVSDWTDLHFWDTATLTKRNTVTIPEAPPAKGRQHDGATAKPGNRTIGLFAQSPDGHTVATTNSQNTIALWHLG
ncbi:WD40 repeat domain-containing protein [Actinomadura yumaensis]|uniref:WD40 repeat domain-containing protein n=2 Tax=Thermomonosporaceae TaxID=2012 RepID=A0ABW2CGT7_9ACTN